MTQAPLFLGIDVGSGSARAGLFDKAGTLLASAKSDITIYRGEADFVEQSSSEIWQAVCTSVRRMMAQANVPPAAVAGIGFDATCSLVVVGPDGEPLPVGDPLLPERNIIVWMDHRANEQAKRINAMGHAVLRYVGNRISPEMETPKLLWLKENLPKVFVKAAHFFDLTDYLTWRSTGSIDRSICTVTCKWTYLGHERRWDESYFRQIGLDELADEAFARIGANVVDAGTPLGSGLTAQAAGDMGLLAGTPVAAGLIDAHAGGVGTVGAASDGANGTVTSRLAYVFGTSACTMASTVNPAFVPGVWGPYFSAMVPGLWLNEAGQSAAGAAIDHLISMHPAAPEALRLAIAAGKGLTLWLADAALTMAPDASQSAKLADGLHVVPEFLGNRAPFSDPDARALIAGLDLDVSVSGLIKLYIAGICGLGYGLRQIIEVQREAGVQVDTIVISGGAGQHPLVRQLMADTTNVKVASPKTEEPVLLGSAMLGAVAALCYADLTQAMASMAAMGNLHLPTDGNSPGLHDKRFETFKLLQEVGRKIR
jgi:D-ribulokinase